MVNTLNYSSEGSNNSPEMEIVHTSQDSPSSLLATQLMLPFLQGKLISRNLKESQAPAISILKHAE